MTTMAQETLLRQVADYTNRANPYPLYTQMRRTPVSRQEDGTYVVSTYREIASLLHDPRISSDERNRSQADSTIASQQHRLSFIFRDPPEHDRLRRLATRQFGPPHSPRLIEQIRITMADIVNRLIDQVQDQREIDIFKSVSYPFPVAIICELLGVPHEDEPYFHTLAEAIIAPKTSEEAIQHTTQATTELGQYLSGLVVVRSKNPGLDMLSGLVTDNGPEGHMSHIEIVSTATLLLIAGHETTVNLTSNGMLTLLRHPDILERLHHEPELIIRVVEELLRYEPPVQYLPQRTTLDEITLAGTTIPKGVPLTLLLAAGNRDPEYFSEPERFNPDRKDLQHLGFGGGIHYCFGAPLARLEVQAALSALVRRLENPRLVIDPPPYRPSSVLRGPGQLLVAVDGVKA